MTNQNSAKKKDLLIKIIPLAALVLELFFGFVSKSSSSPERALVVFMTLWMVMWWVFEVMPLGITALIPIVFLPLFGITPLGDVTTKYAHHVIYLFLGGFVIARALEKTRLSERIALEILKVTGKSDLGIVVGFGVATAFLSMWISNTATTVMMIPIAYSVIHFLNENLEEDKRAQLKALSVVLFLTIAYSANIGGISTPVGTPPNVVFVGFLEELYQIKIDFWKWMLAVTPVAILVLVINFVLLRKIFPYSLDLPQGFTLFIKDKLTQMGKLNAKQIVTLSVFSFVAFLWVFKGLIHNIMGKDFLNDSSVAILGAVLLFFIPSKDHDGQYKATLDKEDIPKLPWNIVLLFGGGMAMAAALNNVGIIEAITGYFAHMGIGSTWLLVAVMALIALFLTEVMSNVALCVVALPVVMNMGVGIDLSPLLIGLPVALCTSFAFMMPISTPPNAIVFGTGAIEVRHMMKAGFFLNILSVLTVMTLGWVLFHWVLL